MQNTENKKQYEVFFGRLGQYPELRRTQDGDFVCDFSVAINHGKDQEPTWKRVVVWGELARQCTGRLSKGSEIFVRGKNSMKSFQTSEGVKKDYEEVAAHLIGFTNV